MDPLAAESFLPGCDLSRCASRILCVAVTSFRGELYDGFMSAPRRGQVVKSFLNARTVGRGYVSAVRTRERKERKESVQARVKSRRRLADEGGLGAQGMDGSKKGTPKQLRVNSASAKSTVYQGRMVVKTYPRGLRGCYASIEPSPDVAYTGVKYEDDSRIA